MTFYGFGLLAIMKNVSRNRFRYSSIVSPDSVHIIFLLGRILIASRSGRFVIHCSKLSKSNFRHRVADFTSVKRMTMNTSIRVARITTVARGRVCNFRYKRNYEGPLDRLYSSTPSFTSSSVVPTNDGVNLPSTLIDFSISAKIEGEESQVAMVTLRPGETLRAESGAMLFMTHGVEMNTDMQGATAAFSRMMTGQNVFLTDFTYTGEQQGTVGLGTDFPSKIVRLTLQDYDNSTLICQRGAYLASNPVVNIDMEFTKKLGTGFFGGQGFILQRLSGQGDVLIKAGGTLVEKDLIEGEVLRVSSGSIVAFTSTVEYDIQMMPGIKNVMFGGEGLFITTLQGPGKVWLQGMPPDRMIAEIARRVPSGGPGIGIPIGLGGGGSTENAGEATGSATEAAAAGGAVAESGAEDMVATSDQAIEADRQATVASSGFMGSDKDADSPSELFGDAAPQNATTSPDPSSIGPDSAGVNNGFVKEPTFTDDATATTLDENSFSDDTSFSSDYEQPNESGFWSEGDQTTTDVFDSGATEEVTSTSSSLFSTLWDFFTGDD